jgi:hypothetical protein
VTDFLDDIAWFDMHPGRRYRLSGGWVVRRRGAVFLRAPIADSRGYPDTEDAAEAAWWLAAFPSLSPLARRQMAAAARQRDVLRSRTQRRPSDQTNAEGGRLGALPPASSVSRGK